MQHSLARTRPVRGLGTSVRWVRYDARCQVSRISVRSSAAASREPWLLRDDGNTIPVELGLERWPCETEELGGMSLVALMQVHGLRQK